MKVGIPKEIKVLEFRVGMVPSGVRELVHDGHDVFVETNAGIGIGMTDMILALILISNLKKK